MKVVALRYVDENRWTVEIQDSSGVVTETPLQLERIGDRVALKLTDEVEHLAVTYPGRVKSLAGAIERLCQAREETAGRATE